MKYRRNARLRILVVEDNRINQIVVSRLLENIGQCADLAANGREAVEAFHARGYDLVFMDCQMPIMDGYTASYRIRLMERKQARRPAFIVAMTADILIGNRDKCLEAGMDEFIAKPILITDLQNMIIKAERSATTGSASALPPEADPAPPFEGLDLGILNRLRALSEDDGEALFRSLISAFLDQSAQKVEELAGFSDLRDFATVAKAAHVLKGLSLNFGALAMTRNCDALQSAAESGDAAALCEILAHLKKALADTRMALSLQNALGGSGDIPGKRAIGANQALA